MNLRALRTWTWAPLAGALVLSVALTACGRTTHTSVPASGGSAATTPVGAPGTRPVNTTTTESLQPSTPPSPSASAADLAGVESDGQAVDAASDQSDADFNAGVSAQSQNDDP